MNKKAKKLLKNTLIFLIGNIGSKLIQFALIPLYTYTLTTDEYGKTDIIFTTISFLIPFFSIQISDGLLRFGLDKKLDKNTVISSSFKIASIGTLASIFLSPLFCISPLLKEWIFYFITILNLRIYHDLLSIILKIKDKNRAYALNSILYTLVLCLASILFLSIFKAGINGYFISHIIANVASMVFIMATAKINILTLVKKSDERILKKLVLYSAPLIINSISYWITTASDRYMLRWIINDSSVGLYAVAAKIPAILTTFTGIFSQAWLLSSIDEYENERDDGYYSSMFANYFQASALICAVLILFVKPFMSIYVSAEYFTSWQYAPFLILAAIFSSISSFVNGIYYAFKKNVVATITTFTGAAFNIVANLILIPKIGIMGAAIATAISWFLVSILKLKYIKECVKLKYNKATVIVTLFLIIAEIVSAYIDLNITGHLLSLSIAATIIIINRELLQKVRLIIANIVKSYTKRQFNRNKTH